MTRLRNIKNNNYHFKGNWQTLINQTGGCIQVPSLYCYFECKTTRETTDIMFSTSLNKLNRLSNHITVTSLHFKTQRTNSVSLGEEKQGRRVVATSLWWIFLQKQALFLERFGPEGWSASSLTLMVSVLFKKSEIKLASCYSFVYMQYVTQSTYHGMWGKKRKRKRMVIWTRNFLLVSFFSCVN